MKIKIALDSILKPILGLLVLNLIVFGYLYENRNRKFDLEYNNILNENYDKLIALSLEIIDPFITTAAKNNQKISSIEVKAGDLKIGFEDDTYIFFNLIKYYKELNKHIPNFLIYRIEINNQLLHTNTKTRYLKPNIFNKKHYLNKNIFFATWLDITDTFWLEKKRIIHEQFLLTSLILCGVFLFLVAIYYISLKKLENFYSKNYKERLKTEIEQLKNYHSKELKTAQTNLLNKIWNYDFNRKQDIDLNFLFAQEANKIAYMESYGGDIQNIIEEKGIQAICKDMPCSIVLYNNQIVNQEFVNVEDLIKVFNGRFKNESEKIAFSISANTKEFVFKSKAAIYQILYSIITYLIFFVSEQAKTDNYNVQVTILQTKKGLSLNFAYDGSIVHSEKQLFSLTDNFFKAHANPFILNLNQIFKILKDDGFDYLIRYNKTNTIEITQKSEAHIASHQNGNVISLDFVNKEKKK